MSDFLEWLDSHASSVQALATVVLVFATGAYVWLTRRLLHSGHDAHLEPVSTEVRESRWTIEVKNFGPGVATAVRLKKLVLLSFTLDPAPNEGDPPLSGFTETEVTPASGPAVIEPGDTVGYKVEHLTNPTEPLILLWQTITGRRHRQIWRFGRSEPSGHWVPAELRFAGRLAYYVGRLYARGRSPLIRERRWWHTRKKGKTGREANRRA